MTIELSKNEYTIAKFLFEETKPLPTNEIIYALDFHKNEKGMPVSNPTRWLKKDTIKPTGYWRVEDAESVIKILLELNLIAFTEKMVGGTGTICDFCGETSYSGQKPLRSYFMTDAQKERFKTVQVKPIEIRVSRLRGRPRKYKNDAERQRAYRERRKALRNNK